MGHAACGAGFHIHAFHYYFLARALPRTFLITHVELIGVGTGDSCWCMHHQAASNYWCVQVQVGRRPPAGVLGAGKLCVPYTCFIWDSYGPTYHSVWGSSCGMDAKFCASDATVSFQEHIHPQAHGSNYGGGNGRRSSV